MSHTPKSSAFSGDSVVNDSRDETGILQLHAAGNATIVVKGSEDKDERRFLVSSETLSVASPYFRALFSPSFKEGLSMRPGTCPEITLEEDDTEAMEILLSILHFHDLDKYQSLEPKTIATVAVQSDKYDCTHALIPWACQWLHDVGILTSPEEYGFLLTAAYLLDSAYYFKSVSAMAIRHMAPGSLSDWSQRNILNRLPLGLRDDLTNGVRLTADSLQNELYITEKHLTEHEPRSIYEMPSKLVCSVCGALWPRYPWKCCDKGPGNIERSGTCISGYCTREQRIADYLKEIREHNLWPSVGIFRTTSVFGIGTLVESAVFDKHQCDGKDHCPLKKELGELPGRLNRIIADVEGISLDPFIRSPKHAKD